MTKEIPNPVFPDPSPQAHGGDAQGDDVHHVDDVIYDHDDNSDHDDVDK